MLSCALATTQTLNGTSPPREAIRDSSRPSTALDPEPIAQADPERPSRRPWIAGSVGKRISGPRRSVTLMINHLPRAVAASRRRRFAPLAGLGAADDLTGRRDELADWHGGRYHRNRVRSAASDHGGIGLCLSDSGRGLRCCWLRCGFGWGGNGLFRC